MKRFIWISCLLISFVSLGAQADVPRTIDYQGRLMDASGKPVVDGNYVVIINLYDSAQANQLWTKTYNSVPTKDGYFNIVLGDETPQWKGLDFNQQYYLGTQVGTDAEMIPRQAWGTVPYALNVANGSVANSKLVEGAVGTTTLANGAVTAEKINVPTMLTTLEQAGYKIQFGTLETTSAAGYKGLRIQLPRAWPTEHVLFMAGFTPSDAWSAILCGSNRLGLDQGEVCFKDERVQNIHLWWLSIGK